MDMLAYFTIKKPDVVHETIDGETVIVNLENGVYYSLRDSAVDVWTLIERGANIDEITNGLLEAYEDAPDTLREDVKQLLIKLQQEGLIEASSTKRAASSDTNENGIAGAGPFRPPLLEKYEDMQELLLLDPIHEVDEEGWPHKAENGGGSPQGGS